MTSMPFQFTRTTPRWPSPFDDGIRMVPAAARRNHPTMLYAHAFRFAWTLFRSPICAPKSESHSNQHYHCLRLLRLACCLWIRCLSENAPPRARPHCRFRFPPPLRHAPTFGLPCTTSRTSSIGLPRGQKSKVRMIWLRTSCFVATNLRIRSRC